MEQMEMGGVATLPATSGREDFETWWKEYPRKVGKGYARRAFSAALKKASFDELLAGLQRYRFSTEPKYVPHASTWLNGERWSDEEIDLEADPWGIADYIAKLAPSDGFSAASYQRDELDQIMAATGLPPTWRGPLDTMNNWLRDGFLPVSIARVIGDAVREFGTRSGLHCFDKRVRHRAERFACMAD